ncbi:MAG: PspC domain-containing protein [Bacteroidetes bacterium]|nr:PspC domain-containing protein [Bacteroidota bacterium]
MIRIISGYFEKKAYGVCSAIADRMGLRAKNVRLSFIYLSFLAVGSPVGLYLILLFWRRNRHVFKPWLWGQRKFE